MRLEKLEYAQHVGVDEEWSIKRPGDLKGIVLGDVNLLVGKNATGKSRTLSVIHALADVLIGKKKPHHAHWRASFEHEGSETVYELKIVGGNVESERLTIGGETPLTRKANGTGTIHAEELNKQMRFEIAKPTPAVIAKRDQIQHSFLEPLHNWADQLRYREFGADMGRATLYMPPTGKPIELDLRETDKVIPIFLMGKEKHGDEFVERIVKDMEKIDYVLDGLVVREMEHVTLPDGKHPFGFAAKEADLRGETVQIEMSQGMFRSLSLIVHTVYAEMSGSAACVLVDDIGEGLDFDRSSKLIELLVDKARSDKFQLIMATNDRFVMNAVPMKEWCCLRRSDRSTEVLTYENSRDLFDKFKLTGLANFDFLTTGYFSESDDDA